MQKLKELREKSGIGRTFPPLTSVLFDGSALSSLRSRMGANPLRNPCCSMATDLVAILAQISVCRGDCVSSSKDAVPCAKKKEGEASDEGGAHHFQKEDLDALENFCLEFLGYCASLSRGSLDVAALEEARKRLCFVLLVLEDEDGDGGNSSSSGFQALIQGLFLTNVLEQVEMTLREVVIPVIEASVEEHASGASLPTPHHHHARGEVLLSAGVLQCLSGDESAGSRVVSMVENDPNEIREIVVIRTPLSSCWTDFARVVTSSPYLLRLNISFCGSRLMGGLLSVSNSLHELISANPALTDLTLAHNDLGEGTVCLLADGLKANTTLTSLNLAGNGMGNAGVTAIASALSTNKGLKYINLESNEIGEEGARQLLFPVLRHKTLVNVYLASNQVSNRTVDAITAALGRGAGMRTRTSERPTEVPPLACLPQHQVADIFVQTLMEFVEGKWPPQLPLMDPDERFDWMVFSTDEDRAKAVAYCVRMIMQQVDVPKQSQLAGSLGQFVKATKEELEQKKNAPAPPQPMKLLSIFNHGKEAHQQFEQETQSAEQQLHRLSLLMASLNSGHGTMGGWKAGAMGVHCNIEFDMNFKTFSFDHPSYQPPGLEQGRAAFLSNRFVRIAGGNRPSHGGVCFGSTFLTTDEMLPGASRVLDAVMAAETLDKGLVVAIADGCGGHYGDRAQDTSIGRASRFAAKHALRMLCQFRDPIHLISSVHAIVKAVEEELTKKPKVEGASTTLLAARVFPFNEGTEFIVAGFQIGDCMLVSWDPQNPSQILSIAPSIATDAGVANFPEAYRTHEIHSFYTRLPRGSVLIAMTDGVVDSLPTEFVEKDYPNGLKYRSTTVQHSLATSIQRAKRGAKHGVMGIMDEILNDVVDKIEVWHQCVRGSTALPGRIGDDIALAAFSLDLTEGDETTPVPIESQ